MDTASLGDLFEQIQVLKDEHGKLLQLIEKERNARREAILETEQAKKVMAESNVYLEGLLRLKAKSEIGAEDTRLQLQFLEQERQKKNQEKERLQGELLRVSNVLQSFRQSFVNGMHSLYNDSACTKFFQPNFLQAFNGELDQKIKEMEQEIEVLRRNTSQIRMAIETKRERKKELSHLEGMREELLRNITELEGADKVHADTLARLRNELVAESQQLLPERLLDDLKEAAEQCLYWKDLLTSLKMQCASQQKKVDDISAKVKVVENESEKFAEAQSKRNRTLPPTWRTRNTISSEPPTRYQTASEALQIASKDAKPKPRGFNPIFLDDANEVEKETGDNDEILTKLW